MLKILGYKSKPDHSAFSKVRTEVREGIIGKVAELIILEIYKFRTISLIAIDSTYIPYFFKNDLDAAWGHVTLTTKEREFLGEKNAKGLKKGYKLHLIYDVEIHLPLYWIVLPTNVNDKDAFKALFNYVRTYFKIAHNARFLEDAA